MYLRKLETNLIELIISQEHNRINPINLFKHSYSDIADRKVEAVEMYRSDPTFSATVKFQVASIMRLIVKYNGGK